MKLIFGSYSGTYKQLRYLEEKNLTNAITETKFSIVCFNAMQNDFQNYGPLIGHINFTNDDLNAFSLTCSNFRNYVKHMCHGYAKKVESKIYFSAYKAILHNLNKIRWLRVQQKPESEIENAISTKFSWLLHKDRVDSLNLPAFDIIDFDDNDAHIQILGFDEVILFSDFIKIYSSFLESKGYNLELLNLGFQKTLQKISDFLVSVNEVTIKFNIGGLNYSMLNNLVEKYDSTNKQITLSTITKSKMTNKHNIPGYLFRYYEIKNNKNEINDELYVEDYKTVDVVEIPYGIFNENKLYIEFFDSFIPAYVIRKFN